MFIKQKGLTQLTHHWETVEDEIMKLVGPVDGRSLFHAEEFALL